ncbi:MAG: hypothetical protein V3U49_07735 [Nitrososphaerales archaeon]
MSQETSLRRLVGVVLISWLSIIGLDLFLHAGLLARIYFAQSPFLLSPLEAFMLIPLGYFSFLILDAFLVWLMKRIGIAGWKQGLQFGLMFGLFAYGGFLLGLLSISTASLILIVGWFVGVAAEFALAGAVIGSALVGSGLRRLSLKVVGLTVAFFMLTIIMQNTGLAPAVVINP